MAKPKVGKQTVKGIDQVLANLNAEMQKMQLASVPGLIECAIVIRRDMETVSPTIPVDTANLRHSFFSVVTGGNGMSSTQDNKGALNPDSKSRHSVITSAAQSAVSKYNHPSMILGFTAAYAIPVHEDMTAKFKRPGSGPKFFEAALKRNYSKFLQILAKHVKQR